MAVVIPLNNFLGPADDTVTAQIYYRIQNTVDVYLRDCPYYQHGVVAEPLCYRELLVALCAAARLRLFEWAQFHAERTGSITDTYVTFVFEKEASTPSGMQT